MAQRLRRQRKTFCTECGSDLDDFWLAAGSAQYEDILKHHLECQREGRFKGSMCSKLFIVDGGTPETSRTAVPVPPRKRSGLKQAIMENIDKEEKKNGRR